MKIAIVTDDGRSISPHFGRATAYAVLTVEDGKVVARELRGKAAPHGQGAPGHRDDPGTHGTSPAVHAVHDQMLAPIADCDYVVSRGMGWGAHDRIAAAGIRPIVTTLQEVDVAAIECAAGTIVDHAEQLH